MKSLIHFLCHEVEFERWRCSVKGIVDTENRLPDSPFTKHFAQYSFEEFDWMLSADSWTSLTRMAQKSDDEQILIAVLEPDPVRYFKAEFGVYSWAVLSTGAGNDDYWTFINQSPVQSPADSILGNSEVVVWMPISKKWAIWGERSTGLCVLASEVNAIFWNNIDWVKNIYRGEDAQDFSIKLQTAFSSKPT